MAFVKLYTALVRPHLEYAQYVWSPHLIKHLHHIERVQMRATKLVDNMKNLDYTERRLNLPTLAYRRLRGDVIDLFKHFRKYNRAIVSKPFQLKARPNRKHKYQLHESRAIDGERGVQSNSLLPFPPTMEHGTPESCRF